jgi:hypothetical protein
MGNRPPRRRLASLAASMRSFLALPPWVVPVLDEVQIQLNVVHAIFLGNLVNICPPYHAVESI